MNKDRTWTLVPESELNEFNLFYLLIEKSKWNSMLIEYSSWRCKWGYILKSNMLHSDISTAKTLAFDYSKLEIISSEHRSHESNPYNKSRTCIIRTLKLFPSEIHPHIFKFEFSSKFSFCLAPTPKYYIVLNVQNNKKERNREKSNTTWQHKEVIFL